MSFYAKIHQFKNEKLLAICDAELLGTRFKHNGIKMSVLPRFYGEMEFSKDEVLVEMKNATSINAMGKKTCELLLEKNYVHPDTIMWLDTGDMKIGHVIVVR